jgi:tetratricopeptide (TPR) repeat protein/predicted Ser/Thr protein kinase
MSRRAEDEGVETLAGESESPDVSRERSREGEADGVESWLSAIASAPSVPVAVAPGDRLADTFEIERRLGMGGMGVVYLAHHVVLDRKVAIKLHRADSAKAAEALVREARAIASVEHEHVVVVHEVGTWQHYVFVAMEYVDGWTAREWVAKRRRTWREIVALYVKAGRGVQAAHERGLTHRDFKPDNVLVGRDGRVRVADFGLARVAAEPADELTTLSHGAAPSVTEGVVGSPGYMAPEQFWTAAVDARADQFGFCVSLFEALSGKRPFRGETLPEIVQAVTEGEPEALGSEHAPAHVRAVLRRGLQREPQDRYPDMATLLAELDRDPARGRWRVAKWVSAVGATVAATWWLSRAADPMIACRKTPDLGGWWDLATKQRVEAAFVATGVPSAMASFAAVDRLLGDRHVAAQALLEEACAATHGAGTMSRAQLDDLGGCLVQSEREQRALLDLLQAQTREVIDRSVAAAESLPPVSRCTAAFRTDDVADADRERADELLRGIARVDELRDAGLYSQSLTEAEALHADVEAFGYPAIEARLLFAMGQAHARLHRPDLGRAPLRKGLQRALAADDARLSTELSIALIFNDGYLDNDVHAGEAWTTMAEGWLERLEQPPELRYRFLHNHALALRVAERYPESLAAAEEALVSIEAAGAAGGVRHAALLGVIGEGHRVIGHPERALATVERSLEMYRAALGDTHPSTINALNILGGAQLNSGDVVTAEATFRKALAIIEGVETGGRARLEIRANLAFALSSSDRIPEGLAMLEAAWADSQTAVIPEDLRIGLGKNLASMNESAGHFARAREINAATTELARKVSGEDSVVYGECLVLRAQLAADDHERALADVDEALRIMQAKLEPDVPLVAIARTTRGTVLERMGRCDQALPELEAGERGLTKAFGEHSPVLTRSRLGVARCLVRLGRHSQAVAKLADVRAIQKSENISGYHEWLIRALVGDGQLAEARAQYQRALAADLSPETRAQLTAMWPAPP